MTQQRISSARSVLTFALIAAATNMVGCEVDSYFDPSKTGRFEYTPTEIPILGRIDVIEREPDPWRNATSVQSEDLIPGELVYRIAPGDYLTVEIFELLLEETLWTATRQVDATGTFRFPDPIGDVRAAGLTAQQFQDELTRLVEERVMENSVVNVVVEDGGGFQYTVYGSVAGTGLYALRRADLRLVDALAQAGGVAPQTEHVFIIRERQLDERMDPFDRPSTTPSEPADQVDIDELINTLDDTGGVNPGLLGQDDEPLVDIDDLEPARDTQQAPVDVEDLQDPSMPINDSGNQDAFIYDAQRAEWIRVRGGDPVAAGQGQPGQAPLVVERIIDIPYQRLKEGDSSYNLVIRPNDRIYVREIDQGVVYIGGEINRVGVYSLPATGKLTLSRLIDAAGGLGPIAIPDRVDLIRMVGNDREATIRVNLAAIRKRTAPDLYLKPDDHIIIGTSWIATPLAVFRNGLRMTYGFGFLLDRNFGNDVFGAPPTNVGNR